jgi:hypothetical protein
MNRSLVFDLVTCAFIGKREIALFLGPVDPATLFTSLLPPKPWQEAIP